MPTHRVQALVLRAYDYSEADRVLVLLTREAGKVRALAKGVRRSQSRLAACLGLLSCSELQLHGKSGKDLCLVTQGQLLGAYGRMKSDLTALGQAGRMSELVEGLTLDRQPLPEIYDLLRSGFELLNEGYPPQTAGVWFEIQLLDRLGYRPDLAACQLCGQDAVHAAYHAEHGGLVCRACRPAGGLSLTPAARQLFLKLQQLNDVQLRRIRLHPQLQAGLADLLDCAVRYQLGRTLRSDIFRRAIADLG